jgi:GT2 family glycosyltransferase
VLFRSARNSGLAATVNPFVAFLDADDLWPEGALDRLMAAAKEAPDAAAIHGRIRRFRDVRDTASTRSRREFGPPQHRIHLGSMLFARWALEKVGGLNEALRLGEDLELLVRLQSAGLARRTIPDVTLLVRRGHGGMTEASEVPPATAHARIWARALADDLRRRRSK